MKNAVLIALIALLFSASLQGQNPPTNVPSGTISFNALNGPFGSTGVDIFGTYGVSTYGELREDNFIFPAANGSFYGGGYQYSLDKYTCPLLINTNISCAKFSSYIDGNAGVGRTEIGKTDKNHVGGGFGFGINWSPTGNGQFTVNLLDFHEEHLAFDTVKGWTTIAAVGINLGFGTNALASEAKLARIRKQQARRLKKMQERAAAANRNN